MEKVLIYGAGQGGRHLAEEILKSSEPYEIVAFIDKYARTESVDIEGLKNDGRRVVIRPEKIIDYDYDEILVAVDDGSVKDILCSKYKVPQNKVNTKKYLNSVANSVRIRALEHFKSICDCYEMSGSTAEVGVYQGDFAKHINRIFPESKLYLYDTFEGFRKEDLEKEQSDSAMLNYVHYDRTAEDVVLNKMIHKDKVIIRKGLFPETATGENDRYVFVNLDADLYAPILAGLEFFYPKMISGGVIFVHDYFNPGCPGVKQAIDEYRKKTNIAIVPLGDYLTIAIPKL